MTKKIAIISVFLFMALIALAGCGSSASMATTKTPTVAQIVQAIKQASDISSMRVADAAGIKKLYEIDTDQLDDFALFTAPSNIKADEIAIFKVKNTSDVQTIRDKIDQRIKKQEKNFGGYLPDEAYLIQHNIVKVKGNYVILIISKDGDKISSAIDKVLN